MSVWGAITFQGLGPLVRIEGRFNADSYYSILDDVLLPYLVEGPTFPDNEFILQHDNSPIHKARKVGVYLDDRDMAILDWPPRSPVVNVTENVWGRMKFSMASRQLHVLSADALWAVVEEQWGRLSSNTTFCHSLDAKLNASHHRRWWRSHALLYRLESEG